MGLSDGAPGHPVADIPTSARVTFLEPYGGGPRWPGRWFKALLTFAILFVVFDYEYPFGIPPGGEFDQSENAVWIASRWSDTLVPPEERQQLASRLATHGVKWIYADEGQLLPDGRLPRPNFMYAGGLVSDVHRAQSGMSVLAWVSGRTTAGGGNLSLAAPGSSTYASISSSNRASTAYTSISSPLPVGIPIISCCWTRYAPPWAVGSFRWPL
jgi:hypothetical protein